MTRWTAFAGVSLVALSLIVPDAAFAQARSRGGSDSPSSSGSSGDSGSRSGGGDSSSSSPRSAGGMSQGTARPRSEPSSSGGAGSQTSATRGGSSNEASSSPRARGSQTARDAQARTGLGYNYRRPTYVVRSYDPWYGYYDPWYGYGYGYGYRPWYRSPYGVAYGVFGAPFMYDPYMGYGYGGSYARDDRDDDRQPTGSIRFRANPKNARVYVDGALVGTVDEFDGLKDHLEIEAGRHQIELRAEGYESYTSEVAVRAGRTVTERASLKKTN